MTRTVCAFTLLAGLAVAQPARAQAPQGKTVISINLGANLQKHPFTTGNSFPLFDETATFEAGQEVRQGLLFDVSGARAVGWRDLSVSVGISSFSRSSSGSVTASIPHPLFFDRSRTTTTSVDGLSHSQLGVHFAAMWTMPVARDLEVAFFAGPSFTRVSQDLVQTVTADASQVATPVVVSQSGTAPGANIGVDIRYALVGRYSAGAFLRYVHGTADLESSANLRVGGTQAGLGLRVRF